MSCVYLNALIQRPAFTHKVLLTDEVFEGLRADFVGEGFHERIIRSVYELANKNVSGSIRARGNKQNKQIKEVKMDTVKYSNPMLAAQILMEEFREMPAVEFSKAFADIIRRGDNS